MFHIGQTVVLTPSKLELGYPREKKDALMHWFRWFVNKYNPIGVIKDICDNDFVLVQFINVKRKIRTSMQFKACIFEPIELDFIEEEYIV